MLWLLQYADKNMNIHLPPLGRLRESADFGNRKRIGLGFNMALCTLKAHKSASFLADLEQSPTNSYWIIIITDTSLKSSGLRGSNAVLLLTRRICKALSPLILQVLRYPAGSSCAWESLPHSAILLWSEQNWAVITVKGACTEKLVWMKTVQELFRVFFLNLFKY